MQTIRLLTSLKLEIKCTVPFFFGIIKVGDAHSEVGCRISTPNFTNLFTSFLDVLRWTCDIGKALLCARFPSPQDWNQSRQEQLNNTRLTRVGTEGVAKDHQCDTKAHYDRTSAFSEGRRLNLPPAAAPGTLRREHGKVRTLMRRLLIICASTLQ